MPSPPPQLIGGGVLTHPSAPVSERRRAHVGSSVFAPETTEQRMRRLQKMHVTAAQQRTQHELEDCRARARGLEIRNRELETRNQVGGGAGGERRVGAAARVAAAVGRRRQAATRAHARARAVERGARRRRAR